MHGMYDEWPFFLGGGGGGGGVDVFILINLAGLILLINLAGLILHHWRQNITRVFVCLTSNNAV